MGDGDVVKVLENGDQDQQEDQDIPEIGVFLVRNSIEIPLVYGAANDPGPLAREPRPGVRATERAHTERDTQSRKASVFDSLALSLATAL